MVGEDTEVGAAQSERGATSKPGGTQFSWMELIKVAALPLVTLILGYVFNDSLNKRQAVDNNMRLYTEIMTKREQADSDLRKDMFKSILDTFMNKISALDREHQLRQKVLNLELLAYNFHESLDIGPLFKDIRSEIPDDNQGAHADLRKRLEKVGREVIERQLAALSDSGMFERGGASIIPEKLEKLKAYLIFRTLSHTVPNPEVKAGEGVTRACLSVESAEDESDKTVRRYRQFTLEILKVDQTTREVQVRLNVSKPLSYNECQQPKLEFASKGEIDTNFWVGLFDFPLIDNTRLTHGERSSVSLMYLDSDQLEVALAYFPGSRASMKDKPYYDQILRELKPNRDTTGVN